MQSRAFPFFFPLPQRPISLALLTWLVAIWMAVTNNIPLWQKLWALRGGFSASNAVFLLVGIVLVTLFLNALLSLLLYPRLVKPVLIPLLLMSAVVAYFVGHYGVMVDSSMIQNTLETDLRETRDLLTPTLLVYVLLLGVLPSFLVYRQQVKPASLGPVLLTKIGVIGLSCLLLMGGVLAFYQDVASLARNHRELRYMLVPSNYLYATVRYFQKAGQRPAQLEVIGADAHKAASWQQRKKPALTVLVVGETARADRFSLNGYGRDTNPRLAQEDVVNFSNVTSCGTSTAVSVPCMFSGLTRNDYSDSKGHSRESLLDVIQRAGFGVQWRDNNSGCKGACDRVAYQDYAQRKNTAHCRQDECYDEVMLDDLQSWLDRQTKDTVLVLHQKGSHGPAYYSRYPQQFAKFGPACQTSELEKCDKAAVGNAFDNTILYTDYFLAQVINRLKQNSERFDTAMLYLSDHGESLGENNLFLHGTPYSIAPDVQKKVPMIAWFSPEYQQSARLDQSCLKAASAQPYSHDNLFHSMLGLLDIETVTYRKELDFFAACRDRA